MILAHRDFAGQINVPDAFTRLLVSVILTDLAPESFYSTDREILPIRAHYDGLPVDFTAKAITALGLKHREGYQTFNLVNPHDDGVSLDTVIGWLEELGYDIRRIRTYENWLQEFGDKLRLLSEDDQNNSVLPLLHGYEKPIDPVSGSEIPSTRFRNEVEKLRLHLGDIPKIDKALIEKYVYALENLGIVQKKNHSVNKF